MRQFLQTRWQLLVALCAFIVVKIPALHYPFFLDESWSYAPAVKLMYLHGPSLMPNAIDLFYSRGHPLLFYALAASWMKVFGASHIAQHSFCLLISLLLLATVFELSLRLFGKRAALFSLLLLPIQVMFFVQSTMLLPELLIALLCLLTLFFFVADKYLLTLLSCTALLFTKESGMVLGLLLGICAAIKLLDKTEPIPARLKRFLSVLLPGVLIGCFYLLQKHQNGWYLFPEHTGLITHSWALFWLRVQYSLDVLFYHDNRLWLFRMLLLLAVVVSIHLKELRYAAPLVPALFIDAVVADRFGFLPRPVLFGLMLLSLLFAAWQLISLSASMGAATKRFVWLSTIFFIGYLSFSCVNFFTVRYLDCLLVIELMLAAAWFALYVGLLYDTIYYLALLAIALAGYFGFKYDTGITDVSLGAFDAMKVEEDVVTYFEQQQLYDKNIFASFTNIVHLQKPYTGFLHTDRTFPNVDFNINSTTSYLILDNIDSVKQFTEIKTSKDYQVVYRTKMGQVWGEVYRK